MTPDAPLHETAQRIYYDDTDAAGVVYHANYLKYYERARTEWLRSAGFDQPSLARDHGVFFAVVRAEVDYLKPARLDDLLRVAVVGAAPKRASVRIDQSIRRGDQTLSTARITLVCVREQGGAPRSAAFPEALAALMRAQAR